MNGVLRAASSVVTVLALLAAPVLAAAQSAPPGNAAAVLAGAPTNGAITMLPGEVYHGPGPITVGYLGAKKQLVIPNGPWLLVSVADRTSGHQPPVGLVSMVFAQFREGQVASLMHYLFNGRSTARVWWPEVKACNDGAAPAGGQKVAGVADAERACGWTVRNSRAPQVNDAGWSRALEALERLGSPVPEGAQQLTRAWIVDGQSNFLSIRRTDYGPGADAAAQAVRANWLQAYLPFMSEGMDKRLGATELEPNDAKPPRVRLTLAD